MGGFWALGEWRHAVVAITESTASLYSNGKVLASTSGVYLPNTVTRTQQFIGKSNWAANGYFEVNYLASNQLF